MKTMPDLIDNYFSATGANLNPLQSYSTTLAGDGVYKPRTLQYEVSGNGIVPPMGTASVTIYNEAFGGPGKSKNWRKESSVAG